MSQPTKETRSNNNKLLEYTVVSRQGGGVCREYIKLRQKHRVTPDSSKANAKLEELQCRGEHVDTCLYHWNRFLNTTEEDKYHWGFFDDNCGYPEWLLTAVNERPRDPLTCHPLCRNITRDWVTKNRYKLKQKDGEDSSKYVDRRRGPDRSTAYPHPARPRSENAGGSTIETQSAVTSGASTVNQATTTIPSTSKTVQYRRDESGNITEVYFGYADCVSTQQKDSNPPERANEDTRMFADFTTMDTVDD